MKVPVLPTPALTDIAVIMNDDVDDWYCQVGIIFKMQTLVKHCAHLQWTTTGSSPGFISSLKSRTNLKIKSILFREFLFVTQSMNPGALGRPCPAILWNEDGVERVGHLPHCPFSPMRIALGIDPQENPALIP